MKLLAVCVRYGEEAYPEAVQHLWQMLDRSFPRAGKFTVVIDNRRRAAESAKLDERTVLAGGDNSVFEFSGWQHGLQALGEKLDTFDAVILCTDAFRNYYTAHLDVFDDRMLDLAVRSPAAVGRIDFWPQPCTLFGHRAQYWLRSGFMLLGMNALRQLPSTVGIADASLLMSRDPAAPFWRDAPLSENYREYVLDWLTGKGSRIGAKYHSTFSLSEATMEHFRRKVLCIVNEHLLTVRLRAAGVACLDVEWLAGQMRPGATIRLRTTPEAQLRMVGRLGTPKLATEAGK